LCGVEAAKNGVQGELSWGGRKGKETTKTRNLHHGKREILAVGASADSRRKDRMVDCRDMKEACGGTLTTTRKEARDKRRGIRWRLHKGGPERRDVTGGGEFASAPMRKT